MSMLNDLTDDLTPSQFQQMLQWLAVNQFRVTRANVRSWRRHASLPFTTS